MSISAIHSRLSNLALVSGPASRTGTAAAASDFQNSVAASQSGSSGGLASEKSEPVSEAAKEKARIAAAEAKRDSLRKELQDYLDKSPAEHMRDAILKEMGMTEDDLNALPPEKREAVEADIARKIRERLLAKDESHPDAVTLQQSTTAGLMQGRNPFAPASAAGEGAGVAGMAEYRLLQQAVNGGHTTTSA